MWYEMSGYTDAVESRESCKACDADYRILDANKDGNISKEEFSTHSSRFASFESFDTDGGGLVTLNEFLARAPDKQQNNCTLCSDCVVRKPSIRVGSWVIVGQTYGKVIAEQTYGIVVVVSESKTDKSYKVTSSLGRKLRCPVSRGGEEIHLYIRLDKSNQNSSPEQIFLEELCRMGKHDGTVS